MRKNFQGLIAAPFTPFENDGTLNEAAIERQAQRLMADGVRGAFVCGTTGEGASLTLDERMRVAQRWCEVAGDTLQVFVHAGHNCQADAAALAAHAQKIGAAAVACIAPSFYKPASAQDLAEFFVPVAAAAPELPFYYYHLPALTGGALRAGDVLAQMHTLIPNLAGVKFTHEDLNDFLTCQNFEEGRYQVLFGRDEILLAALAMGARGAVGSTYNFAAPHYLRMVEAFEGGEQDNAGHIQGRIGRFMNALRTGGGLGGAKYVMALAGVDCGPVRSPLRQPGKEMRTQLEIAWRELNSP